MNENVGASFGLSVLIVVFFAVVLYQPDPPRPITTPATTPVASAEPVEARPPELASRTVERATPQRVAAVARPVSRRTRRSGPAVEPRGAFTKVRDGETLADVARRVYDNDDSLKTLWAANRDLLDGVDAPVSPGSILRTP